MNSLLQSVRCLPIIASDMSGPFLVTLADKLRANDGFEGRAWSADELRCVLLCNPGLVPPCAQGKRCPGQTLICRYANVPITDRKESQFNRALNKSFSSYPQQQNRLHAFQESL